MKAGRSEAAAATDTMLTALLPILLLTLLGLMVVAILLPWLNRLKLTGLEAELSEPARAPARAPAQPSGLKGEIGFGSVSPKSI
jgi:hypothetical protein